MDLRKEIENAMRQVAAEGEKELAAGFGDDTILLESGLDSLDFAIVVARLEDTLGADPFSALDEPVYPRTFSDFLAVYRNHFSQRP